MVIKHLHLMGAFGIGAFQESAFGRDCFLRIIDKVPVHTILCLCLLFGSLECEFSGVLEFWLGVVFEVGVKGFS
jgi:hypothetical protein